MGVKGGDAARDQRLAHLGVQVVRDRRRDRPAGPAGGRARPGARPLPRAVPRARPSSRAPSCCNSRGAMTLAVGTSRAPSARRVVRTPLATGMRSSPTSRRWPRASASWASVISWCCRAREVAPARSARSLDEVAALSGGRRSWTRWWWSMRRRRTGRRSSPAGTGRRGLRRVGADARVRPRASARATRCGARCRSRAGDLIVVYADSDTANFGRALHIRDAGPAAVRAGGAVREGARTTGRSPRPTARSWTTPAASPS